MNQELKVQYRRMGRSGLKLSALSLGAGNWGSKGMEEPEVTETVATALDAGINYFDNAQSYGRGVAEEIMGRVLKRLKLPLRATRTNATRFFVSSI
jgi:aryl-alcohol dehydrogenase-like predicted oxidoreductase